jgi:ABC-type uncharacterized transport system ATPase component
MVTHDPHCAAYGRRQVVFRDGRIVQNTVVQNTVVQNTVAQNTVAQNTVVQNTVAQNATRLPP